MKKVVLLLAALVCANVAIAGIVVTPTSLDFGNVDRNTGAQSSFKLKNTFTGQTTFTVSRTGNFVVSTQSQTLGSNQEITISVSVEAGVSAGNSTGSVTITGGGESATVSLAAHVVDLFATTINATSLDLGNVELGQSKSLSFTVTNTSAGALTYSATPNVSLFSSTSSVNVSAGASGTLNVTFTPVSTGAFTSPLDVKAASGANQQIVGSINLKGTGVLPAGTLVATPGALDFGDVDRNTGKQLSFTLKNNSSTSLACAISVTGGFVVVNQASLSANQQKTISVSIEAGTAAGNKNGTINISAGGTTASVTLTARVVDPFATTINPLTLDFGSVTTATKSLTFTVRNDSTGALSYSGTANPSLYSVSPASLSVAAGQTGTLTVVFTKGNATGSLPGTLDVKAGSQIVGTISLKANVVGPPDLVISITAAPTITLVSNGKKVSVPVKTRNIGGSKSGSCAMKVFFDGTSMNALGTGALDAGAFQDQTIIFIVPANTTGSHQVSVTTDATSLVTESNETNNTATKAVAF